WIVNSVDMVGLEDMVDMAADDSVASAVDAFHTTFSYSHFSSHSHSIIKIAECACLAAIGLIHRKLLYPCRREKAHLFLRRACFILLRTSEQTLNFPKFQ